MIAILALKRISRCVSTAKSPFRCLVLFSFTLFNSQGTFPAAVLGWRNFRIPHPAPAVKCFFHFFQARSRIPGLPRRPSFGTALIGYHIRARLSRSFFTFLRFFRRGFLLSPSLPRPPGLSVTACLYYTRYRRKSTLTFRFF